MENQSCAFKAMRCNSSETEAQRLKSVWPSWLPLTSLLVVAFSLAYHRTLHLDARSAIEGFSADQLAFSVNNPEQMVGNFPSGILSLLNSVVFNIFPLIDRAGLSVSFAFRVMVYVECVVFALAAYYSFRSVAPKTERHLAAIGAAILCASTFLVPDMAGLYFPFYGWVYAFAHAAFLVALIQTTNGNYVIAAATIVLGFATHPIIALFSAIGSFAVVAQQFFEREPLPRLRLFAAFWVLVIGCGSWTALILDQTTVTSGSLSAEEFIALNRAQNKHWFPSYMGFYWESGWRTILPILSTLALAFWASDLSAPTISKRSSRAILWCIVALVLVCLAGLLIAEFVSLPALIKVALHRADRNALMAASLILIPVLYRDFLVGDVFERVLSAILIATPFVTETGLDPLPVAARIGYSLIKTRRQGLSSTPGLVISLSVIGLILTLALIFIVNEQVPKVWPTQVLTIWALVAAIVLFLWFLHISRSVPAMSNLLVIGVMCGGLIWSQQLATLRNEPSRQRAYAALEAQTWIKENTPVGSILMVDPSWSYFGRDKTNRPSFGTPREWLLMSIIYDSKKTHLDEGLRRYMDLGLEYPQYIHDPSIRRTKVMSARLYGDAERNFYEMSAERLTALARKYNIRYFIFQASKLKKGSPLPVVFQNKFYVVSTVN